jgi:D-glycero-D-manno-heptose 1,7-bisphosphate phosphatase
MRAIFFDRDGTVSVGVPTYERVDSLDKAMLLPTTLDGLKKFAKLDFLFFFVTNQAGLAEGLINNENFNAINDKILGLISPSGIKVQETYVCPHGENDHCDCRKPSPKLLLQAAEKYNIELSKSWMIGDRSTDIQTGINAGTKTILVQTGTVMADPEATFVATDLLEAATYIEKIESED